MKGILIYFSFEAKRNEFSVKKYMDNLGVSLVLEEDFEKNKEKISADYVINRTNNYNIAEYFENNGVRVFNNSYVSKIANNKTLAYELMKKNKIDILPVNYDKFPVVVKKNFSKGGKDVFLVKDKKELESIKDIEKENEYLFQKPCDTLGKDVRVYVIGNEIVCACLRSQKNDFRSNFCMGGKAEVYDLSEDEKSVVNKVISLFDFDFVGIDFLFNENKFVFNEIEDSVGARMVYSLCEKDIISDYCEYIKNVLR